VCSIKEECLSRLILFGEASLRHVLTQYVEHFHHERNHQGKGNVLLFPVISQATERHGRVIQFSGVGLHNSAKEGKEFCPTRSLACPARFA
jgi:hypothetical protein